MSSTNIIHCERDSLGASIQAFEYWLFNLDTNLNFLLTSIKSPKKIIRNTVLQRFEYDYNMFHLHYAVISFFYNRSDENT